MSVQYEQGTGWSAVCARGDGFCHVYSSGGAVVASGLWTIPVPTDTLRYLDAAASPDGDVQAVGVGGDDVAYVVRNGQAERLGPCSGPYAVAIQWRDGAFHYYVRRTSEAYEVNGVRVPMPAHLRGESYGFQCILPDGTPAWWIERSGGYPGTSIQNWTEVGGLVAGIFSGPEEIHIRTPDGRVFNAIDGPAHSVRVCQNGARWAIAAATNRGAALLIVPPYPAVVELPSPAPPEQPKPNPGPIVPTPGLPMPESLLADVERVRARVEGLPTPEQLGQMLNEVAWQHRGAGWGLSRKTSGNRVPFPGGGDIAADILHHKPTDTLWDCFQAATGPDAIAKPTWGQAEHHHDPNRPWVAPVQPAGSQDGDPGDEGEPQPEPQPIPDQALASIAADVKAIRALLERHFR